MADATEENPRSPFSVQNPCRFCQDILRALLDCLGFESWRRRDKTGCEEEASSEGTSSSPSDPPPSAADPPADPPASAAAVALRRAPPRPVISSGPGPQTNTNVN